MIFRSRFPQPLIPDQELSAFVFAGAGEHLERPALIDAASGRRLSYGDLRAQIDRFAGGLAQLGVGKGSVAAILLPNLPEYPVVFLGIARAGAAATTLNPAYTAGEIAAQLADSGAGVVVTTPDCLEKARAASGPGVRFVVLGEASGDAVAFDELLNAAWPAPTVDTEPAQDLAALPYSSGTTGLPKGVMLTHRNLVANAVQCAPFYTGPDDVVLAVAPFFHIMGMAVTMVGGLCRGATLVTMPRFDFEQCLRAIEDHRVTSTVVAPPITVALAKHPLVDRYDLSSLRLLTTGGAPLGAQVQQACAARLGCRTAQGWGMTELGAGSVSPPADQAADKPGTVGWCIAGAEMRIVDPASGAELGPGERGELWFRGPNVMKGYLNNAKATAATISDDGWCGSGDVGHVDTDGFLQIVDRLKELIKYKGYQVAPAELEAVLISHPLVADAAVVASPDEEAGEVPKAFLVLKETTDPEAVANEVLAYAAERVAPYKRLRRYELIDAIPRTPSGKIVRRGLIERERLAAHAMSPLSRSSDEQALAAGSLHGLHGRRRTFSSRPSRRSR
jgi:acyl-CoA synthetase (AMP-forming)/AMP-acid ligase II